MGEAQLGPHPRRPVGAAGEAMDFSDQCLQALVLPPTAAGRARFPGVIAARGDTERAANRLDLKGGLLPFDELEHGYRIGLVSAAKKAAALFRISFSWRKRWFSRRSWRSSSRSSLVSPSLRRPASRSDCLTQSRTDSVVTPKPLATSLIGRPPSRTSRTASVLNSGG